MPGGFTAVPNDGLEALMRCKGIPVQARIILWVLRNTVGWHRDAAEFTWGELARDIGTTKQAAWQAGKVLLEEGALVMESRQHGVDGVVDGTVNTVLTKPSTRCLRFHDGLKKDLKKKERNGETPRGGLAPGGGSPPWGKNNGHNGGPGAQQGQQQRQARCGTVGCFIRPRQGDRICEQCVREGK